MDVLYRKLDAQEVKRIDNLLARAEQLEANQAYIAMMADIELPEDEDETESEE